MFQERMIRATSTQRLRASLDYNKHVERDLKNHCNAFGMHVCELLSSKKAHKFYLSSQQNKTSFRNIFVTDWNGVLGFFYYLKIVFTTMPKLEERYLCFLMQEDEWEHGSRVEFLSNNIQHVVERNYKFLVTIYFFINF